MPVSGIKGPPDSPMAAPAHIAPAIAHGNRQNEPLPRPSALPARVFYSAAYFYRSIPFTGGLLRIQSMPASATIAHAYRDEYRGHPCRVDQFYTPWQPVVSLTKSPDFALKRTGEIRGFLLLLTLCDLPDTLHAAEPLGNITTIYYDARTGAISAAGITYFKAFMEPVVRTPRRSGQERIGRDQKAVTVSQQLQQLPSKLTLNVVQQHLLNETITCLKAGLAGGDGDGLGTGV